MPRQVRIEYAGGVYHVMTRGDRPEGVFTDDTDRVWPGPATKLEASNSPRNLCRACAMRLISTKCSSPTKSDLFSNPSRRASPSKRFSTALRAPRCESRGGALLCCRSTRPSGRGGNSQKKFRFCLSRDLLHSTGCATLAQASFADT